MNCVLWIRFQQKEQIFTTSPYVKFLRRVFVTSPYFNRKNRFLHQNICTSPVTTQERNRKKKSLDSPTAQIYVAAHLNVPDEVVALLGRELVPEGEGALLAVVLKPLQQLLRRRRAPPPRRRGRRPSRHHHLRHLSLKPQLQPLPTEKERSRDLRLGSDDLAGTI